MINSRRRSNFIFLLSSFGARTRFSSSSVSRAMEYYIFQVNRSGCATCDGVVCLLARVKPRWVYDGLNFFFLTVTTTASCQYSVVSRNKKGWETASEEQGKISSTYKCLCAVFFQILCAYRCRQRKTELNIVFSLAWSQQ